MSFYGLLVGGQHATTDTGAIHDYHTPGVGYFRQLVRTGLGKLTPLVRRTQGPRAYPVDPANGRKSRRE